MHRPIPRSARDDHGPRQPARLHQGDRRHRRARPRHPPGARAAGDRRDRRPVHEEPRRRAGAALRARAAGRRPPEPAARSAINLFGSMRRMCLALGVDDLETVGARITELLEMKVPEGLFGKLAMLPKLAEVAKFPPRVRSGRAAVPGSRAPGRGRESGRHSVPHDLARRRRALHHAADGDHPRPRARDPQRRDVPRPGARPGHARDALAAPQGGRRALARDGRRAASGCRWSSPSAATRRASTRARLRCRPRSTSSSSPGSSAASRWS